MGLLSPKNCDDKDHEVEDKHLEEVRNAMIEQFSVIPLINNWIHYIIYEQKKWILSRHFCCWRDYIRKWRELTDTIDKEACVEGHLTFTLKRKYFFIWVWNFNIMGLFKEFIFKRRST